DAYDLAGCVGDRGVVIAHDIADQYHLGQGAALAFGRVADSPQVALVQVLQPRQDGAAGAARRVQVALDFDDRGYGIARLAKELHADRPGMGRHAVQDPACRRDQAVAAFLLYTGQAGQELVGDVLAQAGLAKAPPLDAEDLRPQHAVPGRMRAVEPFQLETRLGRVVDLAQVVIQAGDLQPVPLGIDHAPPGQVVERRAPQHGLLAAGVHRDVAAHTGCVGRGRVHGEYLSGGLGRLGDPTCYHARARQDRADRTLDP